MLGPVRDVLSSSQHAVLLADDNRRYVAANDRACELLCIERDRLLELRIDDMTPGRLRGGVEAHWQRFLRAGLDSGRYELQRPGDEPLQVNFAAVANVVPGLHLSIMVPAGEQTDGFTLSAREREVLQLTAGGQRTQDIAALLFLSPATVESHVRNAMKRLGTRTRAHAVAVALARGEISLDDDAA
jgi:DNA-binding CsgD family transcriptional regulator